MGLIAKQRFKDEETGEIYKKNQPLENLSKEREKYLKENFPYLVKDDGVKAEEKEETDNITQDAEKEENAPKKKARSTDASKK